MFTIYALQQDRATLVVAHVPTIAIADRYLDFLYDNHDELGFVGDVDFEVRAAREAVTP